LDNAVKYSDGKIEIPLRLVDNEAIITIRDYGMGIPKFDLQKVRDPLFRSANVSSIQGVGLGVSLVERIISVHKGQLEIRSEEGKGTECIVSIPITKTGN
jgi:signal transduction histidine kinase